MLIVGLVFGMALGAILMLSGMSNPRLIIDMLRFKNLHLLKVLMTALAVGVLGVAFLDAGGLAHIKIKSLHVLAVALGGGFLGLGFAVAGYCPGTALAASVEGRRDALFVVLGGLLGTVAYTLLYGVLEPVLITPLSLGKLTLPGVLGLPHLLVALAMGGALSAVVVYWLRRERRPAVVPVRVAPACSAARSRPASGGV
jgi:uncharacterized protein